MKALRNVIRYRPFYQPFLSNCIDILLCIGTEIFFTTFSAFFYLSYPERPIPIVVLIFLHLALIGTILRLNFSIIITYHECTTFIKSNDKLSRISNLPASELEEEIRVLQNDLDVIDDIIATSKHRTEEMRAKAQDLHLHEYLAYCQLLQKRQSRQPK